MFQIDKKIGPSKFGMLNQKAKKYSVNEHNWNLGSVQNFYLANNR